MSSPSDVVLSDNFTLEGRSVVVFLTPTLLFWEWKSQLADGYREVGDSLYRQDHQSIALADVIGATPIEAGSGSPGHDPSCNCTEMAHLTDSTACGGDSNADLSVYYVKRASAHRWKVRRIIFRQLASTDETGVTARWVTSIRDRLAEPHFNRPRRLLVFVNPLSGNRAAEATYSHRVAPLFDLAGVSSRVIVTEHAGHARDTLLQDDLTPYSGVVCVGGDGMFSELVHGLLLRTRRDEGLGDDHGPDSPEVRPHLRIGAIPAGSTDTVVFSTSGCNDPVTAALHILVGDCIGLDVISVHNADDGRFLRYNVSMLGYGFFGDIIADSEPLRWMGPARYDWLGFKKFCRLRLYRGEVAFRTGPDNNPRDGVTCLSGCSVCCSPETDEEANEGEWKTVRGEFVAVNSFLMSCRCKKAMEGAAPAAHLGNGYADLMLVKNCSRLSYMKHLLRVTDSSADQFDFDFIQVHRVREFRFTPLPDEVSDEEGDDSPPQQQTGSPKVKLKQRLRDVDRVSCWNCDGEMMSQSAIRYRVHRQLILLFGRGVEETEDERRCTSLCASRYCLGCRRAKRM